MMPTGGEDDGIWAFAFACQNEFEPKLDNFDPSTVDENVRSGGEESEEVWREFVAHEY